MSEFQFQKSQRVIIPVSLAGAENVQGVVTAATGFIQREPEYHLQWQACDMMNGNDILDTRNGRVAESALAQAQPPKMIPAIDAEKMAYAAYERGGAELRAELDLERIHRAAKRKRKAKPARKPKSRKR